MATVIDPAGTIEPIEMSSSPAIISNPIGSATIPREAATLSQLAAPLADTKLAPPKTAKKAKTAARPRNEPVSGRRRSFPSEGRWVWLFIETFSSFDFNTSCRGPPLFQRQRSGLGPALGRVRGPAARTMFDQRYPAFAPARVASMLDASTMPGPVRIVGVAVLSP